MKKRTITAWIPAIIWLLFVTYLLCIPGKSIASAHLPHFEGADKVAHIVLFGVLAWLLVRPFLHSLSAAPKWWIIAGVVSIYGLAMELVQLYFIPQRDFDWWDVAADSMGAFSAVGLLLIAIAKRNMLAKNS